MDYLKTLKHEELVKISADFDYLSASQDFIGLKLLPMVKTENMKVAMYNLLQGSEVPVIALVHALDSEARIGDRPEYEEIREELFLIKEKINQGEELRKKIKDLGMSGDDATVIRAIYDDIANQISKVLAGFERRACEALGTAKLVIDENGAKKTVDYKLSNKNKVDFSGWADPTHDIVGDLATLKNKSRNKIVRQIISSKVMGYMVANNGFKEVAKAQLMPVTQDFIVNYVNSAVGIELIVDDRTFKKSYGDTTEYRFFPEDVVISLTTRGTVGQTLMTSTPIEDANTVDSTYGFVAVSQWTSEDPCTSWTKAEGVGFPVIVDINNTLFLSKITA